MSDEIPDFDRIDAAANAITAGDNVIPINGKEEADTEPEMPTSEIIKPLIAIGFGVLAPNWQVTETEIGQLSEAYGGVIDKYLPDNGLDRFGPEISAVLVTAMIVMPRAAVPRKKPEPKKALKSKNPEVKMEPLKDAS